jgi:uncharacterized protein (UPF0335 family)
MPDVGGIAGDQLRSFIERIERLEEEKKILQHDIKEVYAEAKGTGFDTKIMRQLIRLRRMDKDDLDEQETLLDVYKRALGMLPLEEYASRPDVEGIEKQAAKSHERVDAIVAQFDADRANAAAGDLYDQAVAFVSSERKASTSLVQRRLQISFNRAAALMQRMEAAGIVSAANHAGMREYLGEAALPEARPGATE